jgi:hypothetical protein
MAARKTLQQKEVEQLNRTSLDELGSLISKDASNFSRVRTGDLRDSQNFRTKPFNVLTVSENFYGQYQFLKGKKSGNKDPLQEAININITEGVNLYVKNMIDLLISPIV